MSKNNRSGVECFSSESNLGQLLNGVSVTEGKGLKKRNDGVVQTIKMNNTSSYYDRCGSMQLTATT
jgi:hypothetical protein